jgi:general stress protein 26
MAEYEPPQNGSEDIRKVAKLIEGIQFAMLSTIDENGEIHARPMATQQVEFDGDVYFFTDENTSKVADIRRDSRVNVVYASPEKDCYVSLAGNAEISHDKAKMKELWSPGLKIWFEEGLETPGICLIRVKASGVEYWNGPNNKLMKAVNMARFAITRDSSLLGEHATVDVR